jgi:hypothetical protein
VIATNACVTRLSRMMPERKTYMTDAEQDKAVVDAEFQGTSAALLMVERLVKYDVAATDIKVAIENLAAATSRASFCLEQRDTKKMVDEYNPKK